MKTHNASGLTMREAINRGMYYHVSIPHWASGGMDVIADSAKNAAILAGCFLERHGIRPDMANVNRHLAGSSIGCAMLGEGERHETLTASHFYI